MSRPCLSAALVAAFLLLPSSPALAQAGEAAPAGSSPESASLVALVAAIAVAYAVVLIVVVHSYLQLARVRRTISRLEKSLSAGERPETEE